MARSEETSRAADAVRTQWWRLSGDEALDRLESGDRGPSDAQVRARRTAYGPNELAEEGGVSMLRVLLRQFASPVQCH